MKVIVEYDTDENRGEYDIYLIAEHMYTAIDRLSQLLRTVEKYDGGGERLKDCYHEAFFEDLHDIVLESRIEDVM